MKTHQEISFVNTCCLAFFLMAPFYGWGSAAARLQSHYEETVYFQPLSSQEFLVLMKVWANLRATQWFWTQNPWTKCLKESICETRKMFFISLRKLFSFLRYTDFKISDIQMSWRYQMPKHKTRNTFYWITWKVNTVW